MLMIQEVLKNWEPLMFWLFCIHRYSLDIAHSSPSGLLSLALPSQPRVFRSLHFLLSSGYSTHPSRPPLPHWDCFHRGHQGPQNYQSRGHFWVFYLSWPPGGTRLHEPFSFLNFSTPPSSKMSPVPALVLTSQHFPLCAIWGRGGGDLLSFHPLFKCWCVSSFCLLISCDL